ncbi:MAG: hypothetical protein ABUT20_37185, partial [Bacteroidota bacterium]
VKVEGIKKTFLLRSSVNARVLQAPARVDFEYLQIAPDINNFPYGIQRLPLCLKESLNHYLQDVYPLRWQIQ